MKILGVDTGGTFTDFVLVHHHDIRIHKVLSTPADPSAAILQGIEALDLLSDVAEGNLCIVHGSTVATNAALERKGVKTVYVTNKGFKDVLTIGRQARAELYNLTPRPVEPPVPSEYCLEIEGRIDAKGQIIEAMNEAAIQKLVEQIEVIEPEAVAINLLFSFLNDRHERALQARIPENLFCVRSSEILPEYKEYERGIATWLSAWLGPKVSHYLDRLQAALAACPVSMMQSSGGTIALSQAARQAVNLLLSGPAGGLAAVQFLGEQMGEHRFMTFDMGGTSTDVALIDGQINLTSEGKIGAWPVAVPMVDMHTIGAGGGSIVWIDEGGMLQVGPQSAGAQPGPVCYGMGGDALTVTDANLYLGRLCEDAFLGGNMRLDKAAVVEKMQQQARVIGMSPDALAVGILAIANEHMTQALRKISVEKGYNPVDFRLCCFGGAGGLHVCAIADALSMKKALVPVYGGVLSALGMVVAPKMRQLSKTWLCTLSDLDVVEIDKQYATLLIQGKEALRAEGISEEDMVCHKSIDARYRGQSFTLNLPWTCPADLEVEFQTLHKTRYGHVMETDIEIVNLRVSITAKGALSSLPERTDGFEGDTVRMAQLPDREEAIPVYPRESLLPGQTLDGPLLCIEQVSTTLVEQGWRVQVDRWGNLLLDRVD